jgi:hypothetical protein
MVATRSSSSSGDESLRQQSTSSSIFTPVLTGGVQEAGASPSLWMQGLDCFSSFSCRVLLAKLQKLVVFFCDKYIYNKCSIESVLNKKIKKKVRKWEQDLRTTTCIFLFCFFQRKTVAHR